jgi:hypothetical protein
MFLTLLIVISNIHCNNNNDTMKILITIIISSLFISCIYIYMSVYECVHVIEVLHFTLRFFPLRILLYMYTYIYLVTY